MTPILNPEISLNDYSYKGQPLSSIGETKIVELIIRGHDGAFAELYQRYSSDIYNYVLRLISNSGIAEELVQEIFVAVWQSLENFRGNSSVKTWIYRIAYNKTMSWMRTYYRRQEVDEEELLTTNLEPLPENQTMINWQVEMVQSAIGKLTPKHRNVIELFYFSGLSYKEISEVVDCPIGTIKSRMSYALQYLNSLLIAVGLDS